ncbi:MAG: prepilin-type N-terminal cleavage/methylation domain-containing protein [Planctomycetes bacterium]|nr:prepilin-type N-terminal cleavage/methylation domain-containing protein [Planctomycetota bacterium]
MKKAFTLVELMIVVAILGIMAAIVIPAFQGNSEQASESAAKETLRTLRQQIEYYAIEHTGVAPGYPGDDPAVVPNSATFNMQMKDGGYISGLPLNPFNNETTMSVLADADAFPAAATGATGWIYQPKTKIIRLDWTGTDSAGVSYFAY